MNPMEVFSYKYRENISKNNREEGEKYRNSFNKPVQETVEETVQETVEEKKPEVKVAKKGRKSLSSKK